MAQGKLVDGVDCGSARELQAAQWPRGSYKAVLLDQICSPWSGEVFVSPRASRSDGTPSCESEEGWQLVKPRCAHRRSVKRPDDMPPNQAECRAHYLNKVRGLCFNCLASGHEVVLCRNPTRCGFCRRFGHISSECPSHNGRKQTNPCKPVFPNSDHHSRSPPHQPHSFPDRSLVMMLHPRKLEVVNGNKIDPMCEEAGLILLPKIKKSFTRSFPVKSTTENQEQELFKVANLNTVTPQLLATPARMKLDEKAEAVEEFSVRRSGRVEPNQKTIGVKGFEESQDGNFPMPDISGTQTPLQMRSEAEQLIGHKLIKALSNLKHSMVPPPPPSILYNASTKMEADAVSKKSNQRCINKLKIKTQKPGIKVVRDMLTKKWIVMKTHKQVGSSNIKKYKHIYKQPLTAINFEDFKQLLEVARFMESIRRITEEREKNKKKKRNNSH